MERLFRMSITESFVQRTSRFTTVDEVTPGGQHFQMCNSGGIECEVGELLYSLVKCWKPKLIVETGTHLGISSAYMAQALHDNNSGKLVTFEVIFSLLSQARALWKNLGLQGQVDGTLQPSLEAEVVGLIDLLFLDSEPQYRFDEFIKFWPQVTPGGIIAMHDLHPSLGHHGQTHHGVYDWPYGNWEPKLGEYIKNLDVQLIHVPNPRGMVLFQKTRTTDENIRYLKCQTT